MTRLGSMEAALTATEEIAGRLPRGHCREIKDALASLANLNRSIIRLRCSKNASTKPTKNAPPVW